MDWNSLLLAAREQNEQNNWSKILGPLILLGFYALSYIVNAAKQKKEQSGNSSATPAGSSQGRRPVQPAKPRPASRTAKPAVPQQRPQAPVPMQTKRPAMHAPPMTASRTSPKKVTLPPAASVKRTAPLPAHAKKMTAAASAAGALKPIEAQQAGARRPQPQPAQAMPAPAVPIKPRTGLDKIHNLRSDLARAVIYSEILSPPLGFRNQSSIPGLRF